MAVRDRQPALRLRHHHLLTTSWLESACHPAGGIPASRPAVPVRAAARRSSCQSRQHEKREPPAPRTFRPCSDAVAPGYTTTAGGGKRGAAAGTEALGTPGGREQRTPPLRGNHGDGGRTAAGFGEMRGGAQELMGRSSGVMSPAPYGRAWSGP